jgi:hypothetical protein
MDIAFAANRWRVSETLGDLLNRANDILLRLGCRVEQLELSKRQRGQHRSGPGSEVLCGKVLAADLTKVIVHVARPDSSLLAVIVDVLEQLLAREFLAPADDLRQPPIIKVDRTPHAALPAELETETRTANGDVIVAQRCQPKRVVGSRIFGIADTDQCRCQEPNDRREHLFPSQSW